MDPSQRQPRSFSPTLGHLMGVVATAGAYLSLISTIQSASERNFQVYLVAGCVVSYSLYLFFLILISFSYFTHLQILILLATVGGFSALLIQAFAHATGWVAAASILALPVLPFIVGGLMLQHNRRLQPEDPAIGETETLSTLVRNKRLRGLSPQNAPPGDEDQARRLQRADRWKLLAVALVLVLAGVAIGLVYRRLGFLRSASAHAVEESRCRENAILLEQSIEDTLAQGPPTQSSLRKIVESHRNAAEWVRKAEWHARQSARYAGRW